MLRKFMAFLKWIKRGFRPEPLPEPGPDARQYITPEAAREIQAAWAKANGTPLGKVSPYVRLPDTEFYCPSVQYSKRQVAIELRKRRKYAKNVGDCDDFSWMLKAQFVEDAWRNGIKRAPHCVGIFDYDPKGPGPGHSINWVINDDGVFRLIEPQDGSWPSGETVRKIWAMIA